MTPLQLHARSEGGEPGHAAGNQAPESAVERARELHRFDRRPPRLRLVAAAPATDGSLEIADRIAAHVADAVGRDRFARYFADQARIEVEGPTVRVMASSATLAALLDRRFGTALRGAAAELVSTPDQTASVEFVADSARFAAPQPAPAAVRTVERRAEPAVPVGRAVGRPPATPTRTHRLEEFVIGESNRLAYNAAANLVEQSTEESQRTGFSPLLFIHGPCGVGKTHLLHGLTNRFRELHPGAVVRMTSGEAFMNEFVLSIKQTTGGTTSSGTRTPGAAAGSSLGVERFRRQYRRCDLLCIDDVHFLASKQATQQELLHTFDEIALSGARIALVCDRHPRQIRQFSPALVSRFMAGMVASIDAPDAAVRERAIRLFAQRRGLILENAAVQVFVERTRTAPGAPVIGIREIEGLVTRIEAIHRLLAHVTEGDRPVGVLVIERALGDSGTAGDGHAESSSRPRRPVRIEAIASQTCTELGVDAADLGAPTRHKRVVLARAVITHLARQFTTMSYPEIARAIGRPSHSTVITADQRLQKQVEADESYGIGPEGEAMTIRDLLARLSAALSRA